MQEVIVPILLTYLQVAEAEAVAALVLVMDQVDLVLLTQVAVEAHLMVLILEVLEVLVLLF